MTAPAYALALSLLVTAPLLAPGYLLLRDAVSTPRSYLSDAALGLSEAAPRALPQDFAVALASAVLDGGVVVKVLLMAGLWLAGWGAARLAALVMPDAGVAGQFVAATHRDLESLCRGTALARALEPAGGLRLFAVGGYGDAAAAYVDGHTLGWGMCACVLDGAGRADADRIDAGGDRRVDVRLRAGHWAGRGGFVRRWASARRCSWRCRG